MANGNLLIRLSNQRILFGVAALSFASVGIAFAAQHVWDVLPCAWCVLQRLQMIVAGTLALVAALSPWMARLILAGFAELVFASGAASAFYQVTVASLQPGCLFSVASRIIMGLDLERLWPAMFEIQAGCDEAAAPFLGLPFPIWSAVAFILMGFGCNLAMLVIFLKRMSR